MLWYKIKYIYKNNDDDELNICKIYKTNKIERYQIKIREIAHPRDYLQRKLMSLEWNMLINAVV